MSEEVKEVQEAAPETAATGKKKKVNRLSKEDLDKKINELNEKKQNHSRYYKHLIERKKQMEAVS